MSEGGLGAPVRKAIPWQDPDFSDASKLDKELRRVFDICHGCRRCFNLCDSFPRLFDLIDNADTGELDSVASADFKPVIDACTLCDMCFMTKCPYVPPHEFDLDFPHLMLRARAIEARQGKVPFAARQLTKTDRNGKIGSRLAPVANWATKCSNHLTRPALEVVAGVHRDAALPKFHKPALTENTSPPPEINRHAPAYGRKAVLYATCFGNYNNPGIGLAARAVLARNGVETEFIHPRCCGMPQLEQGDISAVADNAVVVAAELGEWIAKDYDVITLVPSCALMLKFEWPLILPGNTAVKTLSDETSDLSEYVVGLHSLEGPVVLHIACHARAQNMGQKAAEMMRLLPQTEIRVIERCSGHGGSWGIMKDNFEVGLKIGRPVARQVVEAKPRYVVSECPLAGDHITQGAERLGGTEADIITAQHPIELMAKAYEPEAAEKS